MSPQATVDVALAPCPTCEEPTRIVRSRGREVRLDPEAHLAGLYAIVAGQLIRRTLVELYRAQRDRRGRVGYDVHVCPAPRSWVDRD